MIVEGGSADVAVTLTLVDVVAVANGAVADVAVAGGDVAVGDAAVAGAKCNVVSVANGDVALTLGCCCWYYWCYWCC